MKDAMQASERLRAYVAEIDRFLDTSQTLPTTLAVEDSQDNDREPSVHESYDQEMMVPLDILQRIPWPGECVESVSLL